MTLFLRSLMLVAPLAAFLFISILQADASVIKTRRITKYPTSTLSELKVEWKFKQKFSVEKWDFGVEIPSVPKFNQFYDKYLSTNAKYSYVQDGSNIRDQSQLRNDSRYCRLYFLNPNLDEGKSVYKNENFQSFKTFTNPDLRTGEITFLFNLKENENKSKDGIHLLRIRCYNLEMKNSLALELDKVFGSGKNSIIDRVITVPARLKNKK